GRRAAREGPAADSPRWNRRLVVGLAAAAVVTTIGVPAAMLWSSSRPDTSAILVKSLTHYPDPKPAPALLDKIYTQPVTRGPSESAAGFSQEFMLGVDLLDFRIALEADDNLNSAQKAWGILSRLDALVPGDVSSVYSEARQLDINHQSPRNLLSRAPASERD